MQVLVQYLQVLDYLMLSVELFVIKYPDFLKQLLFVLE